MGLVAAGVRDWARHVPVRMAVWAARRQGGGAVQSDRRVAVRGLRA